jgi:hypothetical protein
MTPLSCRNAQDFRYNPSGHGRKKRLPMSFLTTSAQNKSGKCQKKWKKREITALMLLRMANL